MSADDIRFGIGWPDVLLTLLKYLVMIAVVIGLAYVAITGAGTNTTGPVGPTGNQQTAPIIENK